MQKGKMQKATGERQEEKWKMQETKCKNTKGKMRKTIF